MSQQELLRAVVERLGNASIAYLVTGSIASSLQGEPRSTHDIDLVVAIRSDDVPLVLQQFSSPDFYVSESAVYEAVKEHGMFNVIDVNGGAKVDFWLLTNDPFDRTRFSRRQSEKAMGFSFFVSTPEDTILAKLRWASLSGGSDKQFGDALGVYEVQRAALDLDYLRSWAARLGVKGLLERIESEAESIEPS